MDYLTFKEHIKNDRISEVIYETKYWFLNSTLDYCIINNCYTSVIYMITALKRRIDLIYYRVAVLKNIKLLKILQQFFPPNKYTAARTAAHLQYGDFVVGDEHLKFLKMCNNNMFVEIDKYIRNNEVPIHILMIGLNLSKFKRFSKVNLILTSYLNTEKDIDC